MSKKERSRGRKIWAVYNHMPYGHMVATWFETTVRERRSGEGDNTTEVTFRAEDSLENFRKTEQVALCRKGPDGKPVLKKNDILVYPKDQDPAEIDPRNPAAVVLKWAEEQGIIAVPDPKRAELPKSEIERVATIEGRVAGVESTLNTVVVTQQQLAAALASLNDTLKALLPKATPPAAPTGSESAGA